MRQSNLIIGDEKGSVLLIAMAILVMLTLVGIAATNTSTIESLIAGNEKDYKKGFYNADAGVSWVVANGPNIDALNIGDLIPQAQRDLDGDGVGDCEVKYTGLISAGPPKKIEVESRSLSGGGNVVITAGIEYPTSSGGTTPEGDPGSYN